MLTNKTPASPISKFGSLSLGSPGFSPLRFAACARNKAAALTAAIVTLGASTASYGNNSNSELRPLPNLQALAKEGASVSALVVNLRTAKVIAEMNAEQRLTPASVTKLVLGAAALETLGSESTITSNFYRSGSLRGAAVEGDLVFVGAGDPYLTNEKLWFLTTDVARLGIKEVKGNLILNTSAFAAFPKDSNRKAGEKSSTHAYDSPLSPVAVNFSVMAAVAGPGEAKGSPARLGLEPYPLDSVILAGNVVTSSASSLQASRARMQSADSEKDKLVASGTVAMGGFPERIYRSVSNAETYAGSTIRAFLLAAGVKITGKVVVDNKAPSKSLVPVASVEGFPLDWQLKGLFKVSNNFIADMLTLQLARAKHPQDGATLELGGEFLQQYTMQALRESAFRGQAKTSGMTVISGSGLTPENRLSAKDIVAVLEKIHKNSREFPSFLSALPIPGAEGTVKKRFASKQAIHLRDTLRGKTGTLQEPLDAIGFAGYARSSDGDTLAFCLLLNGTERRSSFGVQRARAAMDSDLAFLLPN